MIGRYKKLYLSLVIYVLSFILIPLIFVLVYKNTKIYAITFLVASAILVAIVLFRSGRNSKLEYKKAKEEDKEIVKSRLKEFTYNTLIILFISIIFLSLSIVFGII